MLKSNSNRKNTLAYSIAFLFATATAGEHLPVLFLPAAGLLYMVWHIMIGWRLVRLGREHTALVMKQQAAR